MFGLDNFSKKKKKERKKNLQINKIFSPMFISSSRNACLVSTAKTSHLLYLAQVEKKTETRWPHSTKTPDFKKKYVGGITPLCDIIKGQIIILNV